MDGSRIHAKVLTSKELKVRPKSANVPGLELADLLAQRLNTTPDQIDCLAQRPRPTLRLLKH